MLFAFIPESQGCGRVTFCCQEVVCCICLLDYKVLFGFHGLIPKDGMKSRVKTGFRNINLQWWRTLCDVKISEVWLSISKSLLTFLSFPMVLLVTLYVLKWHHGTVIDFAVIWRLIHLLVFLMSMVGTLNRDSSSLSWIGEIQVWYIFLYYDL